MAKHVKVRYPAGMTGWQEQKHDALSAACQDNGVGCDGYQTGVEEGYECECSCHSGMAPLFADNAEVETYHYENYS
jgi:hypothetical protein